MMVVFFILLGLIIFSYWLVKLLLIEFVVVLISFMFIFFNKKLIVKVSILYNECREI